MLQLSANKIIRHSWNRERKAYDVFEITPAPIMTASQLRRFNKYIKKSSYCWEWAGPKTAHGYGAFKIGDKQEASHRIMYRYWFGDILDGNHIHHTCENKSCCNPLHLSQVSPLEHSQAHKA